MITKEEFNKLEVLEQIQLINDLILNDSLTNVCKGIGIDRSTIRKRFKNIGYTFNKDLNTYVCSKSNANNTINTKRQEPIKNGLDINTLHQKIKALEAKLLSLENTVNTINTTRNINTTNTDNTIQVQQFEGDTVSRVYRIYEDVQKEFKVFCKKNSEYKVQDIISSALKEYMDKN